MLEPSASASSSGMNQQPSPRRRVIETLAVFIAAIGFLFGLAPTAPFTRELGVCESGAVRDVLAGNILLPHFIPGPMVHVPPLYWWTAALCVRAFGWAEIALRLPSMVAAALTCALLFAWLSARFDRRAALWAAAALLCSHFFVDAARQPRMDSMLALFVTAAAVFLECADLTGSSDGWPNRRLYLSLAAIMVGMGILTKGILGIVLPGAAIAIYLIARWRLRDLFRIDLIMAFAGGLAIGLAWYIAAYAVGGRQFLDWQLTMNLWSRFVPAEAGGAAYCVHPFWYFAPHIATGFLPWSLYLPVIAIAVWPRRENPLPESVVYMLCWFAGIFLFFSASRGKCLIYILPAFPPLAALTGWAITDALETGVSRPMIMRALTVANTFLAIGIVAIAGVAFDTMVWGMPVGFVSRLHPTDRRFYDIFIEIAAHRDPVLLLWLAIALASAVALIAGIQLRKVNLQLSAVLAIAASSTFFWFGTMNPALARQETLEGFAREVMQTVPPDARIGHIGIEDCDLYFYSPRPIEPVFHFRCGAEPSFPGYIVLRQRRFDAMAPAARACLKPILQSGAGDNEGPRLLVQQVPLTH
jgi:4-amino-4-deoxy-L-arabinose transferase-like glycosyltransferase